jgi:hypothetical protein
LGVPGLVFSSLLFQCLGAPHLGPNASVTIP